MIELPWNSVEEKYLHKSLLDFALDDPSTTVGSLLVVFYLQRYRYVEAYQVDRKLQSVEQDFISKNSVSEEFLFRMRSASHWRAGLVEKSIELLPEVQQQEAKTGKLPEIAVSPVNDTGIPARSDPASFQEPNSTSLLIMKISSSPSGPAYTVENSAHQASDRPLAQLYDQGQSLSNPLASHPEASKQLLFQEFQNCIASIVQSSANSILTVTTSTNSTRIPMTSVNKNPNLETAISQRQVQGRQCVLSVVPQPDQQHVQNAEKYPYKQKLEDQHLKQSFNKGNIIHSNMQSEIQQGEQKHIISSPSQQSVIVASSVMQPSVMQSTPLRRLQQNPESSVQLPMQSGLQQHL